MRISDWSSDVCSSDLGEQAERRAHRLIAGDGEREIVAEQAKLVDRFEAGEAAAQRAQRLGRIEGAEIAELAAVEDRRAAVIRMNPGLTVPDDDALILAADGDRKSTRLNSSH